MLFCFSKNIFFKNLKKEYIILYNKFKYCIKIWIIINLELKLLLTIIERGNSLNLN